MHYIGFQRLVDLADDSLCNRLENDRWGDAVAEKLVEFSADLHYSGRRLLSYDENGDFLAVGFPVGLRDG